MSKFLVVLALLFATPAFAQQVPSPINAPASVTSGHGLCATANAQQAADCGAAPGTVTSVTASSPLSSTGGTTPNISIASPLSVGVGGTGNGSATAHSLPINEGSSAQANTGTMGAGQLLIGQGTSADPAAKTLSGDCTLTSAGAITCLYVNGVSFAPSATTDATNASNLSSGTVPAARLPGIPTLLSSNTASNVAASANAALCLVGTQFVTNIANVGRVTMPFPAAGTLKNLYVYAATSVTAGSVTVAVVHNGTTSALATTISTGQSNSDTTDSVSMAAGDTAYLLVTSTSSFSGSYLTVAAEFDTQ